MKKLESFVIAFAQKHRDTGNEAPGMILLGNML
jgi:hypothetical protein